MRRRSVLAGARLTGTNGGTHMKWHLAAGLLFVLWAGPVVAQTAGEVDAGSAELDGLRQAIETLRTEYEERIAELETRLAALEAAGAGGSPGIGAAGGVVVQPGQAATAEVPVGAAGAGGPAGALPVYGGTAAASKIFNPDVAVVGDFLGVVGRNAVDPGPAFEMHEAEMSLQAVVDPFARADFFFAFSPEEGVEIEEGYITFPTLPGGVLMKAGKLRAAFGRVNTTHNHALQWTDRPLVTQNLVGGEEGIADSGVSVSRLLLNPWFFLEATGEVYLGESNVFATHQRSDLTYVGRLRGYQDLTETSNVDLGASIAYGHNDRGEDFTTRLVGIDATFRYRPLRRAIYRRVQGRTELIWSRRGQPGADAHAFGFYAYGEYQFARRWFGGLRYDYSERAYDSTRADRGASLLVTFWPSEFSQVRGQYRRTRYAEGETANEFLFQFLFSIGAHGAHPF